MTRKTAKFNCCSNPKVIHFKCTSIRLPSGSHWAPIMSLNTVRRMWQMLVCLTEASLLLSLKFFARILQLIIVCTFLAIDNCLHVSLVSTWLHFFQSLILSFTSQRWYFWTPTDSAVLHTLNRICVDEVTDARAPTSAKQALRIFGCRYSEYHYHR